MAFRPSQFANRLRTASLRDLKDLGGWKSEQMMIRVYQQPSESAQRTALLTLGSGSSTGSKPEGAAEVPTGTGNGHTPVTSQIEIPATG